MREIAAAVGVSKAALYYHFEDKEALLLAILVADLERIEALIASARAQSSSPRVQLDAIMRGIMASAPEQRSIIRLASQELDHLSEVTRRQFSQTYHRKFIGQIQAILDEGMARGLLRPFDSLQTTWVLLGMMYPFFYPSHATEMGDADRAIELILTIFFDGASRDPEHRPTP